MDTETYKGFQIVIEQDNNPANPCREFDLLGTQVYWHSRLGLGHEYVNTSRQIPVEWLITRLVNAHSLPDDKVDDLQDDLIKALQEFEKYNLVIPVFFYEHGGITIRAESKGTGWDSWDSGQLGFVYVSLSDIKREFQVKRLTRKVLEKARDVLRSEVRLYDDYLQGEVYTYFVKSNDGEVLDSCGGYYGEEGKKEALENAKRYIDWQIAEESKELAYLDQRMLQGYAEAK